MSFFLSSRSLRNIKDAGFEEDFEIDMFDDKIQCSKFVASYLSPKISKILQSDPTTRKFTVDINDYPIIYSSYDELKTAMKESNFFSQIRQLFEGQPIQAEENDDKRKESIETTNKLLVEIGHLLDNDEMIEFGISELYKTDKQEESIENLEEKMKIYRKLSNKEMNEKSVEFIAKHFYDFFKDKEEELKKVTGEELERILRHPQLKIESEDWLFETVFSLGREFFFLFDYIEIQYLSVENVKTIVELFDREEITAHNLIWSSICRRLFLDPYRHNDMINPRILQTETKCENGIFKHLSEIEKGNVYSSKIIDVKSSDVHEGKIENLFDHSKSTYFRVHNSENGFITFDFKKKKINFSKYYLSVPASNTGTSNGRPKTWRIEGSNDCNNWEEIDFKENDSSLSEYGNSNTFSCKNINNHFYRFIRIKDVTTHGNYAYILLSEIEFYGSIKE